MKDHGYTRFDRNVYRVATYFVYRFRDVTDLATPNGAIKPCHGRSLSKHDSVFVACRLDSSSKDNDMTLNSSIYNCVMTSLRFRFAEISRPHSVPKP